MSLDRWAQGVICTGSCPTERFNIENGRQLSANDQDGKIQRKRLTTAGVTPGIRMSMEKLEEEKSCCGLIPDAHSPGSGERLSRDLEEDERADHSRNGHMVTAITTKTRRSEVDCSPAPLCQTFQSFRSCVPQRVCAQKGYKNKISKVRLLCRC